MVTTYTFEVPAAGVPAKVAVPFPLSLKVTPLGRVPVSLSDGAGKPAVVTVKLPADPSLKVVLLAEVMVGGPSTVRVKLWLAAGLTLLLAPMVRG
jgi:hypothetical protein